MPNRSIPSGRRNQATTSANILYIRVSQMVPAARLDPRATMAGRLVRHPLPYLFHLEKKSDT